MSSNLSLVADPPVDEPKKKYTREARIRTIRLGDMRISPAAQRNANQARVKIIADHLVLERIGTLTVSHRDGFYYVIDGQHRFLALKAFWGEGFESWEVEAWTYSGLSEEEEALKFLEHNDVLAVAGYDKFAVGVTAGLAVPSDINRIVLSLGLKVARGKGANAISAVGALEKTYRSVGPNGLVKTLAAIRDGFGEQGYEGPIVEGVGLFIGRYEGRIQLDRLAKQLNSTQGGVKGLMNRANYFREHLGGSRPQCVAAAVTETYNRGLRGVASLGSWWKDGGE